MSKLYSNYKKKLFSLAQVKVYLHGLSILQYYNSLESTQYGLSIHNQK